MTRAKKAAATPVDPAVAEQTRQLVATQIAQQHARYEAAHANRNDDPTVGQLHWPRHDREFAYCNRCGLCCDGRAPVDGRAMCPGHAVPADPAFIAQLDATIARTDAAIAERDAKRRTEQAQHDAERTERMRIAARKAAEAPPPAKAVATT